MIIILVSYNAEHSLFYPVHTIIVDFLASGGASGHRALLTRLIKVARQHHSAARQVLVVRPRDVVIVD